MVVGELAECHVMEDFGHVMEHFAVMKGKKHSFSVVSHRNIIGE